MRYEVREKRLTNKQLRERLDDIESFDEIYNGCCLNWFEKLANMPATESENRAPRKLLGAWCYNWRQCWADHNIHELVKNWLQDSTAPTLFE